MNLQFPKASYLMLPMLLSYAFGPIHCGFSIILSANTKDTSEQYTRDEGLQESTTHATFQGLIGKMADRCIEVISHYGGYTEYGRILKSNMAKHFVCFDVNSALFGPCPSS